MLKQKNLLTSICFLCLIIFFFLSGCGNKADHHNKEGLTLYNQHKYDEAIAEFKKSLEIEPNHYEAHYGLGMAYYAKKKIDKAIEELKAAINIDPNIPKGHYNLAFAYIADENVADALKSYQNAIDLYAANKNKKEAEAYLYKSVAYSLIEEHDKALEACKKAIEIDPELKDGHYFLGVCYYKNDMFDEAITELKKTIELDPKAEKAYSVLYVIYDKLGMQDEAIDTKIAIERFKRERRINRNYQ